MIDLHIHTSFSDGSYFPNEILGLAESAGLEWISFTDHNTIDTYSSLGKKEEYEIKIITGCEVSCIVNGLSIEILGYKMDINKFSRWLKKYFSKEVQLKFQREWLKKLKFLCYKEGLKFDPNLEIHDDLPYTLVMRNELIKYEENKKILSPEVWKVMSAFRKMYCWNPETPLFIDESSGKTTLEETVWAIRKAGGLAFLAHIFEYGLNDNDIPDFLNIITNDNTIDGIECFHSNFTEDESNYLLDFCKKHNLLICGGSDFHGSLNPDVHLGSGKGNLKIPYNLVSNWCKND